MLTQTHSRWTLPLLAVVGVAAATAYQSTSGQNGGAPPRPAVVATVDLVSVFQQLDSRAAADVELQKLADELTRLSQAKIEQAKQLEIDLDMHVQGTPKYDEAEDKWKQATMEAQALTEYGKLKLDHKVAESLRTAYEDLKVGLKSFAQERGYDVILLNDSISALEKGTKDQVEQQISARRVLYAADTLDVTNDVVAWMNGKR
jgi:Skp family chaperone for outer membrane proteins